MNYSGTTTPAGYACSGCNKTGIKLWREYNSFNVRTASARCGAQEQEVPLNSIQVDGARTDQIGGRIPAVPTEDEETYWGYTSIPCQAYEWWQALPL